MKPAWYFLQFCKKKNLNMKTIVVKLPNVKLLDNPSGMAASFQAGDRQTDMMLRMIVRYSVGEDA
jgi:hypothetical protein